MTIHLNQRNKIAAVPGSSTTKARLPASRFRLLDGEGRANSLLDLLAETSLDQFPLISGFWVCLIFFKFAIEEGFLIRVKWRASEQVRLLHLANAIEYFATIPLPKLG